MSAVTKLMTAGGGGVALTPASSIASDVTVNVPSQNCTLGIQGPAFSAYQSIVQSISSATLTALSADAEDFDTAACFNNTGSTVGGIPAYSFLPNVAGYYQVTGQVVFNGNPTGEVFCSIYKNGSRFMDGTFTYYVSAPSDVVSATATGLIYLNGSTDYITLYCHQNSGSSKNTFAGLRASRVQAALVRAA